MQCWGSYTVNQFVFKCSKEMNTSPPTHTYLLSLVPGSQFSISMFMTISLDMVNL